MYQPPEHGGPAIYASPKAPLTLPTHKPLSVKTRSYLGAALIIILFLALSAINLSLAKFYYQSQADNDLIPPLQAKAQHIESHLSYLRKFIEHIARQPATQDLLTFNDTDSAQRWALQIRRFLPQASGVALFDNHGNILGAPIDQPLDPLCLSDLGQLSQGRQVKSPPIHLGIPQSAHFDLTTPVRDEAGNPLGLFFVSFGLDKLQALLRDNSRNGQYFILRDGHGDVITEWGHLATGTTAHSASRPIHRSDWQLQLTEAVPNLPSLGFISLVVFNISAFLLIAGSLALLVRRHTRRIEGDFRQVRCHIEQLASGHADARPPSPGLSETARILPALSDIRHNLGAQQQQLIRQNRTDPLTGLANHRQFNTEFSRAYDFARRNIPVCVVRIRLGGVNTLPEKTARHTVKRLARTLLQISRKVDLAARLGDDQFALLLIGTKRNGIEACLQRLRDNFSSQRRKYPDTTGARACILYCGYTLIHRHRDNDPGQVLARTEQALREADDKQPVIEK